MTREPQFSYLRDLVRAWASGEDRPVPPPGRLDREAFLRVFACEAAAPALAGCLHRDAIPPGDWARCQKALSITRQRTTWLLLELERILPALTEAGCRPVVLKGPPLAVDLYPRPEDRWFVDLDVLLARDELPAAYRALERVGYRFAETPCSPRYYEQHHFHRILRGAHGIYLEAHWAVTLPGSAYTYDLDGLHRRAIARPLGRIEMLAPSYGDQVLHGVLQSVACGFTDLRRFLDLHLLDARLDDAERALLAERAAAHNLATALWLQYHVRQELTGAPAPAAIARGCAPTERVRRLLENLGAADGCLTKRLHGREGYDQLLHLLCLPSKYRLREIGRWLRPDEVRLLELGIDPAALRHPLNRARFLVRRSRIAARILGYTTRAAVAPVGWR